MGINPKLSAVQVKQIICQSAEKMGSGERRLNTYRAVSTARLTDPDSKTITVDETSALLGFVYDFVTNENGTADRQLLNADIAIYDESGNKLIRNIKLNGELFFSIIDYDLESMQMSGTCSVKAGNSGSSYDVYYQNGKAYAVINSGYGQVVRELDTLPSESLMELDYDFSNATISNWSEEDNKISFRADGSILDLDKILKDVFNNPFDDSSFTCDEISIELVKDSKGRPKSITLIYTVNIWVKDGNETATGTADYVEKISFSEYGTAAVQHFNQ